MKRYSAPWSPWLWGLSVFTVIACALVVYYRLYYLMHFEVRSFSSWLTLIVFLFPILSLFFMIRGYSIGNGELRIHRLLWDTVISLQTLRSAKYDPNIMRSSYRLFGNGGAFSFTGIYRNSTLGNYRAFVTDLRKTVALHFPKRTIVISPGDPEDFVRTISEA
ncbi:MAG: PH domain-containing protein [Chthoniobacterales bacterium]